MALLLPAVAAACLVSVTPFKGLVIQEDRLGKLEFMVTSVYFELQSWIGMASNASLTGIRVCSLWGGNESALHN